MSRPSSVPASVHAGPRRAFSHTRSPTVTMPSMESPNLDTAAATASVSLDVLSELLENARLQGWVAEESRLYGAMAPTERTVGQPDSISCSKDTAGLSLKAGGPSLIWCLAT